MAVEQERVQRARGSGGFGQVQERDLALDGGIAALVVILEEVTDLSWSAATKSTAAAEPNILGDLR